MRANIGVLLLFLATSAAVAQPARSSPREFRPGAFRGPADLPPGRFRSQLEALPPAAREHAVGWLRSFHFTQDDLPALHADARGSIFYACAPAPAAAAPENPAPIGTATLPVSPFPTHLAFHSRPGALNVLYLNFSGETVTGTAWNDVVNRDPIPARPFSTDSDAATFTDAEQLAIFRIWLRVSEDYAPFHVDVTTERPASLNTRTAMALITRSTDVNGNANPFPSVGGVAYVNVFGTLSYSQFRPAWIYHNNLGNSEAYIAEAVSHEIGHNLGLSHDGLKTGTEYYGGHGTGEISWSTLMGTGYGRNVTQWSKGEYTLANNTQDDLATITARLTYRADDHGNTVGAATLLSMTEGTNVVSTTPETDPANAAPANKGVLERNTDSDMFAFVTGTGTVHLAVNPWIMPAGLTRGGNLDVLLELYNDSGTLLGTVNPPLGTAALIHTNLTEGRYYLRVRNSGAGTPLASPPTGYTSYGSLGQYFISGYVTLPGGFITPPSAELQIPDVTLTGQGSNLFTVAYADNAAISVATLDSRDIRILGPNGYNRLTPLVSVDIPTDGTPRIATYAADPPAGRWLPADNGTYTVWMEAFQVGDTEGAWMSALQLGQFSVNVPASVYVADMSAHPGWTLEPLWQYGPPAYPRGGPPSGYTGTDIVAYNLSGLYENSLAMKYATTPPIDCTGNSSLTLRFRRWLRLKAGDTAVIQASPNGSDWTTVWTTSDAVSDPTWTDVQHALPAALAGSTTVRLRWGIASDAGNNDIGWNIDDVEVLGNWEVDAAPPVPALNVANITLGGAPTHSCSVTFTDDTAVRLASLDSQDIVVLGPDGYSNAVEFVAADLPSDGSPCTGTYDIPAPGGTWDIADNGEYTVILNGNAVEDVLGNGIPAAVLGSFTVTLSPPPMVQLSTAVNHPAWGSVQPSNSAFQAGSSVQILATPFPYYRFDSWAGDASGTLNPLVLVLQSNSYVVAVFGEIMTTNHPTPHAWLAANGYTNDFESAVSLVGSNAMEVWQSYVAGLDPNNPQDRLELAASLAPAGAGFELHWTTATGRLYAIRSGTNLLESLAPLPGATNLPWTVRSFTNAWSPDARIRYYRLDVTKPY